MSSSAANSHNSVNGAPASRGLVTRALPLIPLGAVFGLIPFVRRVANGETLLLSWSWVPRLDVNLSFHLDGLSLLFALLITGVGAAIFAYAPAYLGKHADRAKLYAWLMLFMTSMLGLVLSDNVVTLFVFWELTSITSYMLIGFEHGKSRARQAALQALLVTGLGGLVLLAGLLLLGQAGGSYELSVLVQRADVLQSHSLFIPSLVLVLVGAFTKSAQFPFHFWLPNAMQAPTPVSAYLHSATMVKAGVYLVARLSPAASGVALWDYSLIVIGMLTALTGGWQALLQTDLKRILAYSTLSTLGVLMLLLGMGTTLATTAAVVLLVAHSFYKATLFLVTGTVDHCAGTRDIRRLSGLLRAAPLVAIAATLAGLSMAGLPPSGGFLAKELIYEALLDPTSFLPTVAVLLASASFVAVACLTVVIPFFGKPAAPTRLAHPATWGLVAPPLLLGLLGMLIGVFTSEFGKYLVAPAVLAVQPESVVVPLKLWHGFNVPLLLSGVTLLCGVGILIFRSRIRALGQTVRQLWPWSADAGYEAALAALKQVASWQTRVLQNGKLRNYLLVVVATFTSFVAFELLEHIELPPGSAWLHLQVYELFIPVLILAAAVMAVRATSRLAAVCALGVIGYAVAMLFVMYGAPDLAMTQFAIETLTVILFVFVIYRLPRFARLSSTKARARDAVLASAAGTVMAAVVLAATAAHAPSRLSRYFADSSLSVAKGKNIVNVILVDFRGLDTLGEITVLSVAALGIYTLMRLRITEGSSDQKVISENDYANLGRSREIITDASHTLTEARKRHATSEEQR